MPFIIILVMGSFCFLGCQNQEGESKSQSTSQPTSATTEASEVSMNANDLPDTEEPRSNQDPRGQQRARASRSIEQLKKRQVPLYSGPLFVDADSEVKLQSPQDVAKRTLVLWAVELRAEGVPQAECLQLINNLNLWASVSPEEKRFLEDEDPDPNESQDLVWRLESIWVLLWALGYHDELDWPEGMCDVPKLVKILQPQEANPKFIAEAKLRGKKEILDAQDLIMRIHWAIRDAHLNHGGMIPDNLDWSQNGENVHVSRSAAVGVVEQRHYTLNWLVRFLSPTDWDHVDTPT